jgi:hypothetical protein
MDARLRWGDVDLRFSVASQGMTGITRNLSPSIGME